VNSVTVTACSATAPINPPYALSFGNTADPANDKKFPMPDSTCITSIEQYMGRTDVAVVGQDGNIIIQQGTPSNDPAHRYAPSVSADNLTLNRIAVPPYPNITINLSNNVVDVIDTSVHTKGQTGTRLASHTIVPIVANSQTSVPTQPAGYSMAKIGQLERRIRDLEYYTSLSILETSITNKIIPSSIDGSLNRFKFGFAADDFSTVLYSDRTNPQYAAEIEVVDNTVDTTENIPQLASNLCVPPKFRWSLNHKVDLSIPYIDFGILIQDLATVSPDVVQPACIPVSTTTTTSNTVITHGTGTTQTVSQVNALAFSTATTNGSVMYEKFSTLSGHATLYFDIASDPVFEVWQSPNQNNTGATKLIDSAASVSLTAADSNYLLHDPQTASFWLPASIAGQTYNFGGSTGTILTGTVGPNNLQHLSGAYVQGSGKIEFTHDPSKGLYYFIKIFGILGGPVGQSTSWRYWAMVRYPEDRIVTQTYVTDISTIVYHPVTVIDPCGRTGAAAGYSGTATAKYGKNSSTVPDGTREFDSVIIQCSGLLPATRHYLYVNGVKDTTDTKPYGGVVGDPIVSDISGRITCIYNLATTNWANREAELGLTKTPSTANLILNEGQTFASNFVGNAYMLFEVLAPNSRAGATLNYVPWTGY